MKVKRLPYRPWPVTISNLVSDDRGIVTTQTETFVAHWRPMSESALQDHVTEVFGLSTDEEREAAARKRSLAESALLDAEFYGALIVGWAGVTDEAGEPVPFDFVTLSNLIQGPDGSALRRGLAASLLEIRLGIAPLKNAEPSPAPGQVSAAEATTSSPTTAAEPA